MTKALETLQKALLISNMKANEIQHHCSQSHVAGGKI